MSAIKNKTISIRTTDEIKQLLSIAAEREHRSIASMIEVLIIDYVKRHQIQLQEPARRSN